MLSCASFDFTDSDDEAYSIRYPSDLCFEPTEPNQLLANFSERESIDVLSKETPNMITPTSRFLAFSALALVLNFGIPTIAQAVVHAGKTRLSNPISSSTSPTQIITNVGKNIGSSGIGFGPKKFPKSLSKRAFVFNQIFEYLFFLSQLVSLADFATGNSSTKLQQQQLELISGQMSQLYVLLAQNNQKLNQIMIVGGSMGLFQVVRGIGRVVGTVSAAHNGKKLFDRLKRLFTGERKRGPFPNFPNEWEDLTNPWASLSEVFAKPKQPKPYSIPFLPIFLGFLASQNQLLLEHIPHLKALLFRQKPVELRWYEKLSQKAVWAVKKRPILILLLVLLIIYHKKVLGVASDPQERFQMFDYLKFQTKNLETAYQQSIKHLIDFVSHFQKRSDEYAAQEKVRSAQIESELIKEREINRPNESTIHKLDVNLVQNKNLVFQCNAELSKTFFF